MTYRHLLCSAFLAAGALAHFSCESEAELKLKKYKVVGQRVYVENCANCHQTDGQGLAAIYPPLNKSDYLKNKEKVICLIRHGLNGPIVVNGRSYNRPMPANPQLTDIDVATLTTYLYTQWGGETGITDVKEVSKVLAECGGAAVENE
ncbi:c-type cytochrome [Tellurirhabdus rosea]|uniref:c-type cytochrome n=1 Tax=Tellurirhabdus rosea TaxID=2674997 RepID=UPI002256B70F|nr:cytochrome c [Tellurirhabdus rosea]